MKLAVGQRLEPIVYYCEVRKKKFKRLVLVNDEFEIRRRLSGLELLLKTAWNNHQYLLLNRIDNKAVRLIGTGSKSIPAYLFGPEHKNAKHEGEGLWDLTREAYGIKVEETA